MPEALTEPQTAWGGGYNQLKTFPKETKMCTPNGSRAALDLLWGETGIGFLGSFSVNFR